MSEKPKVKLRKKRRSRKPESLEPVVLNPALSETLTVPYAAYLWDLTRSTLNKACKAGTFAQGEYIKQGHGYLLTRTGMLKTYGKPIKEEK